LTKRNDDAGSLTFTVALEESKHIFNTAIEDPNSYYRRSYLTANIKVKLNQRAFRERILLADHNQCTLCRLKHIELLDAAHIIED
jgi:putative restriction endonuclease